MRCQSSMLSYLFLGKKTKKVYLWMLRFQGNVMKVQSSLFWSRQKRRIKKEDRHLKCSEQSRSWIRPCGSAGFLKESLPLAPRKVLNIETVRAREVDADASWEMKSICPPAACLSDKDRRGEMEGGVRPESRREWGNYFCCCCILLINHFSFKTDV